jgi:hypothetical protein
MPSISMKKKTVQKITVFITTKQTLHPILVYYKEKLLYKFSTYLIF